MARHDPADDELLGGDLDQEAIGGDSESKRDLADALAFPAFGGDGRQRPGLD